MSLLQEGAIVMGDVTRGIIVGVNNLVNPVKARVEKEVKYSEWNMRGRGLDTGREVIGKGPYIPGLSIHMRETVAQEFTRTKQVTWKIVFEQKVK